MFVHPELVEGSLGIDSKYPAFKKRKSRAFSERACPGDVYSVEVIGHAFADELFRIFPNKNPGIEITSINTTDAVSRMIRAASSNN